MPGQEDFYSASLLITTCTVRLQFMCVIYIFVHLELKIPKTAQLADCSVTSKLISD